MIGRLSLALVLGGLLSGAVLAAQPASLKQARELYISTKLDCDNMSKFQKDVCLRSADEAYQQAKATLGE
jgi:Holliday junction resolvase RusA-like endonuclease